MNSTSIKNKVSDPPINHNCHQTKVDWIWKIKLLIRSKIKKVNSIKERKREGSKKGVGQKECKPNEEKIMTIVMMNCKNNNKQ